MFQGIMQGITPWTTILLSMIALRQNSLWTSWFGKGPPNILAMPILHFSIDFVKRVNQAQEHRKLSSESSCHPLELRDTLAFPDQEPLHSTMSKFTLYQT